MAPSIALCSYFFSLFRTPALLHGVSSSAWGRWGDAYLREAIGMGWRSSNSPASRYVHSAIPAKIVSFRALGRLHLELPAVCGLITCLANSAGKASERAEWVEKAAALPPISDSGTGVFEGQEPVGSYPDLAATYLKDSLNEASPWPLHTLLLAP